MKSVFVNRYFYPDHSATSQLLSDLCFFLADKGFQVHVVTSRQLYEDPEAELAEEEEVNGVKVHRVWTSRFGRTHLLLRAVDYLTFYLSAGYKLLSLVSREDVIVAKTDPPLISVVAWLVAKLKGAMLINWLQDLYPEVAMALEVRGMGLMSGVLCSLRNLSLRYLPQRESCVELSIVLCVCVIKRSLSLCRVRLNPGMGTTRANLF